MNIESEYSRISKEIYDLVTQGERHFIIYPYGFVGEMVTAILRSKFKIEPAYIIDNKLCKINPAIKPVEYLTKIDPEKYLLILASNNAHVIESLRHSVYLHYCEERVYELFPQMGGKDSRVTWLSRYSLLVRDEKMAGSVAECGVFRGDYAQYINSFFPDRKLYLFDSFDGFRKEDLLEKDFHERELSDGHCIPDNILESLISFSTTSVPLVMKKMIYPENVIIKQGYVPETLFGIDDEFCFVNLDMDLYKPMLEGLRFFYPRIVHGGVLMVHDYYGQHAPGVKKAISEFEKERNYDLLKYPLERSSSLLVIKP